MDRLQIGFAVTWKVEIDHDVDGLNVNTTREQVRTHEITAETRAEIVKDTITMFLTHLRVNVITTVAEFGDFLGEQLDTLR
jgi:hypothetical protein